MPRVSIGRESKGGKSAEERSNTAQILYTQTPQMTLKESSIKSAYIHDEETETSRHTTLPRVHPLITGMVWHSKPCRIEY